MMFKRVVLSLLVFIVILPYRCAFSVESTHNFLVIYDSEKPFGTEDNTLNSLVKGILTTNSKVKIRSLSTYTEDDLIKAKGIIFLINKDESKEILENRDFESYEEKSLLIYKGYLLMGIVPLSINGSDGSVMISHILNEKYELNLEDNAYIIFDKVYPYDDLELLIEKVDFLSSQGIPFLISAMPVYDNKEMDAMKRYTEVLRYCESKGGTIVIGEYEKFSLEINEEEIIEKTGRAMDTFINYRVYPRGVNIKDEDLYSVDRKSFINSASTLLVDGENSLREINCGNFDIGPFSNFIIKLDDGENYFDFKPNSCGYKIDINLDLEEFKKKVAILKEKNVDIYGGESLLGKLSFGNYIVETKPQGLFVNNERVNTEYFTTKEDLEDKVETEENEDVVDLKNVNKGIYIVTTIGVVIFIICFIIGLKIDRRKYFK